MTSAGSAFVKRKLKAKVGAAAWVIVSALSTRKLRSGTAATPWYAGFFAQRLEETSHLAPDLRPARKPMPVCPDQAHQLEALIDGRQVVFGGPVSAGVPEAVHQKSLHIRFHLCQRRIFPSQIAPGVK